VRVEYLKNTSRTVKISQVVAPNLMFRGMADSFFDSLERTAVKRLVLDFAGVKSISRSFAHQYIIRQNNSNKKIIEVNLNKDVAMMLRITRNVSQSGPSLILPPIPPPEALII